MQVDRGRYQLLWLNKMKYEYGRSYNVDVENLKKRGVMIKIKSNNFQHQFGEIM